MKNLLNEGPADLLTSCKFIMYCAASSRIENFLKTPTVFRLPTARSVSLLFCSCQEASLQPLRRRTFSPLPLIGSLPPLLLHLLQPVPQCAFFSSFFAFSFLRRRQPKKRCCRLLSYQKKKLDRMKALQALIRLSPCKITKKGCDYRISPIIIKLQRTKPKHTRIFELLYYG